MILDVIHPLVPTGFWPSPAMSGHWFTELCASLLIQFKGVHVKVVCRFRVLQAVEAHACRQVSEANSRVTTVLLKQQKTDCHTGASAVAAAHLSQLFRVVAPSKRQRSDRSATGRRPLRVVSSPYPWAAQSLVRYSAQRSGCSGKGVCCRTGESRSQAVGAASGA